MCEYLKQTYGVVMVFIIVLLIKLPFPISFCTDKLRLLQVGPFIRNSCNPRVSLLRIMARGCTAFSEFGTSLIQSRPATLCHHRPDKRVWFALSNILWNTKVSLMNDDLRLNSKKVKTDIKHTLERSCVVSMREK